jgi:hypothetical protein
MNAPLLTTLEPPPIDTRSARRPVDRPNPPDEFQRKLAEERTAQPDIRSAREGRDHEADAPRTSPDGPENGHEKTEPPPPTKTDEPEVAASEPAPAKAEAGASAPPPDSGAAAKPALTTAQPAPTEAQSTPKAALQVHQPAPVPALAANATPQQTNAVTAAPTHDTSPGPAQQIDPALRSAPVQIVQAAVQPEAPPPTTEPVEPQPAGRRAPVSPVPQQTIVTGQSAADAAAAAPPPVTASPAPVRPATRAPGASAPVRAAATVQGDDAKQVPVQAVGSEKGEGSAVTVSRAPDVQEAPARPVNPAVARAVQVDSAVQLLNSAILAAPGGEAAPAVPNAAALSLGTVAEQADSAGNTNQPLTDAKAAVESGPPSKIVRGLMIRFRGVHRLDAPGARRPRRQPRHAAHRPREPGPRGRAPFDPHAGAARARLRHRRRGRPAGLAR